MRTTVNGIVTHYTSTVMNGYAAVGAETRAYDANGNLLQVSRLSPGGEQRVYLPLIIRRTAPSGAAQGAGPAALGVWLRATEPVTDTVVDYRYDWANRLLAVTTTVTLRSDAGREVHTHGVRFTYDALGRRTSTAAPGSTTRYVYWAGQVIEEWDEAGLLTASYVPGLVFNRGAGRLYYGEDGVGSVRELADSAGSLVERVDYEPFGAPRFEAGAPASLAGNPYLFRCQRYDPDSSLYVLGARHYDPATGRFLQPGTPNLGNPYTFAGNNPLR